MERSWTTCQILFSFSLVTVVIDSTFGIFGMLLHTEERQSGFAMLESAYAGILVDSLFLAGGLGSEIRSSSFA